MPKACFVPDLYQVQDICKFLRHLFQVVGEPKQKSCGAEPLTGLASSDLASIIANLEAKPIEMVPLEL